MKSLIVPPGGGPATRVRESGGTVLSVGAITDGQFLRRSGSSLVSAAVSSALPIEAARIEYGAIADLFFSFSDVTSTQQSTNIGTDTLRARQIVFGVDGVVSVIGALIGTGVATSVMRVGLYETGDDGMPSTLLVGSDEFDCSSNTRKLTTGLSVAVRCDRTYWWAALAGVAAPNVVALNTAARTPAFLVTAAATTGAVVGHISVAQAYGALPATWPSGATTVATVANIPMPLIGVSR